MKKAVCIMLTALLLLSVTLTAGAQQSGLPALDGEQRALLSALGLYGGEDEAAAITRRDLAKLAFQIINMPGVSGVQCAFTDIEEEDDEIRIAAQLGIVNGVTQTAFLPEQPATFKEAIKAMIAIAQYDVLIRSRGGSFSDYLTMANRLGILRGISAQQEDTVSFGMLYVIAYNTLHARFYAQTAFGEGVVYSEDGMETVLSHYFHIVQIRGVLTANGTTALGGWQKCGGDYLTIENHLLKKNTSRYDSYIGYRVDAYYSTEQADDTLVYLSPRNHNQVTTIYADSLWTDDAEYSPKRIVYENAFGDRKFMDIKSQVDVFYNGVLLYDFTIADLSLHSGKLSLIDNNGDDVCDTIQIAVFDTVVVDSVDAGNGVVYGRFGIRLELELSDSKTKIENQAGEPLELKNVKSGDVLSIYRDREKKQTRIVVVSNQAVGVVSKITESGFCLAESEYIEYQYAVSYTSSADAAANKPVKQGDKVKLYLDGHGKVAAVDIMISSAGEYGYLYKIAQKKGLNGAVQFRIFTTGAQKTDYVLEEQIKLNGKKVKATDILKDSRFIQKQKTVRQLVKYATNDQGKITKLYISDPAYTEDDALKLYHDSGDGLMRYITASRQFDSLYGLSGDCVIFGVPRETDGVFDEEQLSVVSNTHFSNDRTYKNLAFYDCDDTNYAQVVVYTDFVQEKASTYYSVIKSIALSVNSQGETVYTIHYLNEGREKQSQTAPDMSVQNIKVGDVGQIYLNDKGEVVRFAKFYSLNDAFEIFAQNALGGTVIWRGENVICTGVAGRTADDRIMVQTALDDGTDILSARPFAINANTRVYLYDSTQTKADRRFKIISFKDIKAASGADTWDGDRVFINKRYDVVNDIIVLR